MFGRYGWRDLEHRRSGDDSAAVGRRRQRQHLRAEQAARAGRDLRGERAVAARNALRVVEHAGRQESTGARRDQTTFGITGLADRRAHRRRICPSQSISGYSALGRQATNPQWQYPTVWNPKINYTWLMGQQSFKAGYEFQKIDVEVQDVNPLYGLDTYTGQFTRPAGVAANNIYNLADFMLGLRSQYALSTFFVAEMRQQHALRLPAGRHPRERQADGERRSPLRVRDADVGSEQRAHQLRSRDALDGQGHGRLDCRPRARRSGSQQLRAAARVCLSGRRRRPSIRGGWGTELRPHQPHRIGEPARRSTVRRSCVPRSCRAIRRRRRSGRPSRGIRPG